VNRTPTEVDTVATAVAPWLVRIAERYHAALVPSLVLLISMAVYGGIYASYDLTASNWDTPRRYWGMALTYALISSYFLLCLPYQWRRSRDALSGLHAAGTIEQPDFQRLTPGSASQQLTFTVGFLFGLTQYPDLLELPSYGELALPLSVMAVGNGFVWALAFWVIGQRLQAAREVSRPGRRARIDLYALERVRPFARLALVDVLVVMGAIAFMPLQSLDAEFRWDNYSIGLAVALPTALLMLVLPLWGVHRSLLGARTLRLNELQIQLDRADRSDLAGLELLLAHRERVRGVHTWPLDLRLFGRALFYLVIPPLAWVGAALVESLVDGLL